ncbi:DUF1566 domain-containing protein [Thiocapsa rosea]|uniref:Uncharacterized protein DUF1566 n=1 Tax=Thiocapsa rosea TaxID=69360 RepID=A0A495VEL4_9GAMM|nr:DUF1566 domain-containing protein [Thiocapsa rosea]RKT47270.1 uncharacterized protein DUF1566 [Thiocapsa rosea]
MMPGRAAFVLMIVQGVLVAPSFAEQTCDTSRYPLSSPTERFSDNGDGTVTDEVAQLMWMRCSTGQSWSGSTCVGEAAVYDWPGAQELAATTNASGVRFFNDWRVPQLRDLAMIAERQCENPRINLAVFPSTPPSLFWTASLRPGEGFEDHAYALSFGPEGVQHVAKTERHAVRLVRTAP